jgi:phage/plasmid-like protein (TIGR03299 family)
MAHEVERMMLLKDKGQSSAWHMNETRERVMELSEQPENVDAALDAAGLNWPVGVVPLWAEVPDGAGKSDLVPVPMGKAVRRETDGRILSVVGNDWHPVQNRTAFEVLDDLKRAGICEYETAGSLRHGQIVWIAMRVNGEREIVPGDPVKNLLVFWNAHSSAKAPSFAPTVIRPVCMNTLNMAMSGAGGYALKVKHSAKAEARVRALADLFGPSLASFEENVTMFKSLAKFQMTTGSMDSLLIDLFPNPVPKAGAKKRVDPEQQAAAKKRAAISSLWQGQMIGGDKFLPTKYRFTAWTAFNAVCEFIDHKRGQADCRIEQSWLGNGRKERDAALAAICKVASVEPIKVNVKVGARRAA